MTHFIYYHRGHDRIRIEGTITDRTPDGKRVHVEFEDGDGITVELAHLYDMDEINGEARRYVDCLDNATRWMRAGLEGAVHVENTIAADIKDQWSGEAVDLFEYAVDKIRRERHDAQQAAKVEESEGTKSVAWYIGQTVNGWVVTSYNGATEYTVQNMDYVVRFHTEAGYGRNYSKPLQVHDIKTGRNYTAQRFLQKHIGDVQELSSRLFFEFKVENYQNQLEMETN